MVYQQIQLTKERLSSEVFQRRFWGHVKKTSGCWLWTGKIQKSKWPYGRVHLNVGPYRRKYIQAHRASWVIHRGPIPENMLVLHRCDNPLCVNPDHLFLGDHLANQRDMIAKGRAPHRERHPAAILNEEVVRQIRNFHRESRRGLKETAKVVGVAIATIRDIIDNVTWKDPNFIPPPMLNKVRKRS